MKQTQGTHRKDADQQQQPQEPDKPSSAVPPFPSYEHFTATCPPVRPAPSFYDHEWGLLNKPLTSRDYISIQYVTDGISLMMHQQREMDLVMMRHGHQVSKYLNAQGQFLDRLGEFIHEIQQ
jgi:hypothetical protein